jgi:hypothetical protein
LSPTRSRGRDQGCNAVFGRLRQAAEETCKLATGKEYVGCDMRLFYNGNKDDSGVRLAQGLLRKKPDLFR